MEPLMIGAILVLIILVVDTRQKLERLKQDMADLEYRGQMVRPKEPPLGR